MSFQRDWNDAAPVDHTLIPNVPSSIRAVRVDLEDRLSGVLYGFVSGETLTGIKVMPANVQGSDPAAVADQVQIYSKDANSTAELFVRDEAGNVIQITSAGALNIAKATIINAIYPIGSIYAEITGTNPGTTFGTGTWVAWGTGRVPVGVDTGQTEFATVELTGGEKTHQLVASEMPSHTHTMTFNKTGGGVGGTPESLAQNATPSILNTGSAGSDGAHNNLQPYITCYMWKRTA